MLAWREALWRDETASKIEHEEFKWIESEVQSEQTSWRELQLVVEQRTVRENSLLDAGLHWTREIIDGYFIFVLFCLKFVYKVHHWPTGVQKLHHNVVLIAPRVQEAQVPAGDDPIQTAKHTLHQPGENQVQLLRRIFIDDLHQILASLEESFGGRISFKICQKVTGLLQRWSSHEGLLGLSPPMHSPLGSHLHRGS